jgi:hypothetical protein
MKTIINLIVGGAIIIILLIATGMLDKDQLLDIFAGEVFMGDTESRYTEADFINVFDIIMGEMDVSDTSRTTFNRTRGIGCNNAYVTTITHSTVKYQVQSSPELFYVDVEKKTYYVSPNLGVTYHEADRRTRTTVEESNCIKQKDIKPEDIERAKAIADRNFKKSIENSEKWKNAEARFAVIKTELLDKLSEAGFQEVPPSTEFLN